MSLLAMVTLAKDFLTEVFLLAGRVAPWVERAVTLLGRETMLESMIEIWVHSLTTSYSVWPSLSMMVLEERQAAL